MVRIKFMLLAVVALALCRVLSSPGSSRGATVGDEGFNAFGFAEMFTPQANLTLTGINLQLSGYNDYNSGSQQDSTLELYISQDVTYYNPSIPFMEPAVALAEGTATINNATGTDYDFSLSGSLMANTPYWLSLFLVGPDGSYGISASWDDATLVSANPAGIDINGYETGVGSIGPPFQPGTAIPISVVPEASSAHLLILGWVLLLLCRESTVNGFRNVPRSWPRLRSMRLD
jgi:hypothetical protein